MNQIGLSTALALAAFTPFITRGQDLSDNSNPNRFSFGPTFGINFKAHFDNNVNPGPATGDANHNYDDGYVRVDSSGDAAGFTQNWGYQNASQAVGNIMQFHAIQDSSASSSTTGDPQYGGELVYQRVIGSFSGQSGDWGIESGLGLTEIDLRGNLNGAGTVTTDAYPLNGVIPPGPGYKGTASGPGAVIGDTPTRTVTAATLVGYQKLTGQLFSLRVGPFGEWNFTHKLRLAASVGLTLAPTTVDYDFSETATLAGGGVISENGHSSRTALLYGPYVGAMLHYDLNESWGVFVGARFQNLTDLNQSIGGRTAQLDPGVTLYATAGLTWKF